MLPSLTLAIMQPYFLPYLGYFQLMAKADTFVLYDDVSFINKGWINRNRININGTAHMLTVPLQHASQNKLICEISLSEDPVWRGKALKSIQQAYAKAPQYTRVYPLLENIINNPSQNLAEFLRNSLVLLRDHLKLQTRLIESSRHYGNQALKAQTRIIDICRREKASLYINAVGGQDLYCRADFEEMGLRLAFLQPSLSPYQTGNVAFIPGLSIVDVLMHNDEQTVNDLVHAGSLS